MVQCLPAVAQPTRRSPPHSKGKGLYSYLGQMLPFSTQSAGQREAVCHGLVCFAVSQWRWLGVWEKRGLGALLVNGEPASHWATGRICKMVTSFVPTLGPWQCGEFPGLVRCGSDRLRCQTALRRCDTACICGWSYLTHRQAGRRVWLLQACLASDPMSSRAQQNGERLSSLTLPFLLSQWRSFFMVCLTSTRNSLAAIHAVYAWMGLCVLFPPWR